MTLHRLIIAWRRRCRASRLLQILLLLGFWLAGELIVRAFGLQLPGSIAGMLIVLGLLLSKRLSPRTVRRGAQWFLAEMLLFFVPAVLALLDHPELLRLEGLKILAVILLGTLTVMVATAGVIDLCFRLMRAGKGERHVTR